MLSPRVRDGAGPSWSAGGAEAVARAGTWTPGGSWPLLWTHLFLGKAAESQASSAGSNEAGTSLPFTSSTVDSFCFTNALRNRGKCLLPSWGNLINEILVVLAQCLYRHHPLRCSRLWALVLGPLLHSDGVLLYTPSPLAFRCLHTNAREEAPDQGRLPRWPWRVGMATCGWRGPVPGPRGGGG